MTTTRTWMHNTQRLLDRVQQTRCGRLWVTDQDTIAAAIDELTWIPVTAGQTITLPFNPGMIIKSAVKTLELTHVQAMATNGAIPATDDYEGPGLISLYGIEHRSGDHLHRLYIVDEGTHWFVTAYDSTPT